MLLKELKELLAKTSDRAVRIQLADGASVPASFHVTEVGQVAKTFVDCGGKVRSTTACVIQAWLGEDVQHRLSSAKLAKILRLSERVVMVDRIPVELEYERGVVSQYPVLEAEVTDSEIVLKVGLKHTACLAKDDCGQPSPGAIPIAAQGGCC